MGFGKTKWIDEGIEGRVNADSEDEEGLRIDFRVDGGV
jgi:hypothetical protein